MARTAPRCSPKRSYAITASILADATTECLTRSACCFSRFRNDEPVSSPEIRGAVSISRRPPDIRGAVWFEAATSRLQRIEFNWTTLPGNAPTLNLGGELVFAWNKSGAVQVDRWRLRMPQDIVTISFMTGPSRRTGIVEEGGWCSPTHRPLARAPRPCAVTFASMAEER
jgi:hypothetical protein